MVGDIYMWWQYGIIFFTLIIISLVIVKLNKKNFNFEINDLVKHLGGKGNIIDSEVNMSRLKVTLRDVSLVDKDAIQKLGAKGIVEIDNQLKIIFGPNARNLKKYISQMK
jgi:glucose-like phosphotransferase system IIB component